jgi:RND family efflux transporter MFP subunit
VVEVLAERGDTVSPQNPVAVVMNDGLMKATLTLPERDYGRLVNRDAPISARVRPLAYEGEIVVTGEVTAVSRTIDPASRTFSAEVAVDNPDDLLRPGMYVDIDLILSQRNDAVVVPSSAVVQRNGHSVVFTAEARGDGAPIARPVPVKLGLRHGAVVEIREGLDGTEEIIIEGNAFLEAGQAVRPIAQDGSS